MFALSPCDSLFILSVPFFFHKMFRIFPLLLSVTAWVAVVWSNDSTNSLGKPTFRAGSVWVFFPRYSPHECVRVCVTWSNPGHSAMSPWGHRHTISLLLAWLDVVCVRKQCAHPGIISCNIDNCSKACHYLLKQQYQQHTMTIIYRKSTSSDAITGTINMVSNKGRNLIFTF